MLPLLKAGSRPSASEERDRAIEALMKKLDVEAVKKSNVILVSYEAPSPELARGVVSQVIRFRAGPAAIADTMLRRRRSSWAIKQTCFAPS